MEQRLCLGLALWNGRDPILKERVFGLTGEEGNHGEDVKEYWWYLDAVPSHAWNRWRYHYPQAAFPYEDLRAENRRRGKFDMEYELLDTGVFDDDRYWITEVWYAKADPTDVLMTVRVTNAGPDAGTVHVLPTAWFRNTWSWDTGAPKPVLAGAGGTAVRAGHPFLGSLELLAGAGPDGTSPVPLFCENETNLARLYGAAPTTPYPKDGIGEHVIHGHSGDNPESSARRRAAQVRQGRGPHVRPPERGVHSAHRTDPGQGPRQDQLQDAQLPQNRSHHLRRHRLHQGKPRKRLDMGRGGRIHGRVVLPARRHHQRPTIAQGSETARHPCGWPTPSHGGLPALMDGSASRELWRHARSNVLIVNPDAPGTLSVWPADRSADAELLRS